MIEEKIQLRRNKIVALVLALAVVFCLLLLLYASKTGDATPA